jgi:hypothetical protein
MDLDDGDLDEADDDFVEVEGAVAPRFRAPPSAAGHLPMPYEGKRGVIGNRERADYQRRRAAYEQEHPGVLASIRSISHYTVGKAWDLLRPYMTQEVAALDGADAPVLIVVLERALSAGERRACVTFTDIFDAVCRRFAEHHAFAVATTVYDMRKATVSACWHDLARQGIRLEAIYEAAIVSWSEKERRQPNPLFRVKAYRDGEHTMKSVSLDGQGVDPSIARDFRRILEDGGFASSRRGHRLLPARADDAPRSRREPETYRVYSDSERYDVVEQRPVDVFELQEDAILLFAVDAFLEDYKKAQSRRDELVARCRDEFGVDPSLSRTDRQVGGDKTIWSVRDEQLSYRSMESALHAPRRDAVRPGRQPALRLEKEAAKQLLRDVMERARKRKKQEEEARARKKKKQEEEEPKKEEEPEDPEKRWTLGKIKYFRQWLVRVGSRVPEDALTRENLLACEDAARDVRMAAMPLIEEHDRCDRIVTEFRHVRDQLDGETGYLRIRNVFRRTLNRRYQPRFFGPIHVSAQGPERDNVWRLHRKRWFKAGSPDRSTPYEELVSLDISSSQTQILAAFLGDRNLEEIASTRSFKIVMAEIAWEMHLEPHDAFELYSVAPDLARLIPAYSAYSGSEDARLQNLCKHLWMRNCYGSTLYKVVEDQKASPEAFGPGWPVFAATRFLDRMFRKFPAVKRFLDACQRVAEIAFEKDPHAGVVLVDPLDESTFRWNPIRRKLNKCAHGHHPVFISAPPGSKPYAVDEHDLRKRIAPCLVHTLDAFYSSLVMRELSRLGVRDMVGIHDCWLVPARVLTPSGVARGQDLLQGAVARACAPWYRGLGCVYESLRHYLRDDPVHGPWIDGAEELWRERCERADYPRFQAKGDE